MTKTKPRGDDPSIGIEQFLEEMQKSVNKMYALWMKQGYDKSEFQNELRKYVKENTFAFDEHGDIENTAKQNKHIDDITKVLLTGAQIYFEERN
jgi:hypothetical protein